MPLPPDIDDALRDFAAARGLDPAASSTFEAFAAYHVLANEGFLDHESALALEGNKRILVGGSQDIQLDAIAILINGRLFTPDDSLDMVERTASEGGKLSVTFLFVQATGDQFRNGRSKNLSSKIALFSDGVFNFLTAPDPEETDRTPFNSDVGRWIRLKNRLFALLDEYEIAGACRCCMYLVWPGHWQRDDASLAAASSVATGKLAGHIALAGRFADVRFLPLDAPALSHVISQAEQSNECQIDATKFIRRPTMPGVDASYTGYLYVHELLELITIPAPDGKEERLNRRMYHNNVRNFLGPDSPVNEAIEDTIRDPVKRARFGAVNGGITIIARSAEMREGGVLHLKSVQIIDGYQTSGTIFENRDALLPPGEETMFVNVDIIVTNDNEVADAAILGLNRHSPIDDVQLLARRDYVARLARHVAGMGRRHPEARLWFERRVGEFRGDDSVPRARTISIYEMMKGYWAAFSTSPEQVNMSKARCKLLERVEQGEIFARQHNPNFYYVTALMIWRAREATARSNAVKNWARFGARNQLIHAMRILAERCTGERGLPAQRHGPAATRYIDRLCKTMIDPYHGPTIAETAIDVVVRAAKALDCKVNYGSGGKKAMSDKVRELAMAIELPRVNGYDGCATGRDA